MSTPKDSEILSAARDLIADEKSWVKGSWCTTPEEDESGKIRMCAEGAVRVGYHLVLNNLKLEDIPQPRIFQIAVDETPETDRLERRLVDTAQKLIPEVGFIDMDGMFRAGNILYEFNDATTTDDDGNERWITKHADIMAIFDKTILELQEQGK